MKVYKPCVGERRVWSNSKKPSIHERRLSDRMKFHEDYRCQCERRAKCTGCVVIVVLLVITMVSIIMNSMSGGGL